MKRRVLASIVLLGVFASLPGCHKTDSSVKNSTANGGGTGSDNSEIVFQVGQDTSEYYSCKNLDYSIPDNDSLLVVFGGLISDTSIWTLVMSDTDVPMVYLEQFDLDGNREDTIELGSFSDVELGYDNPYMYEDDQNVYIVSYPTLGELWVYQVNKNDRKISGSKIELETPHTGDMLGFRNDLFYVMSYNDHNEFVCYGYDLSSGDCKFKSEPDAETGSYIWLGDNLINMNHTETAGTYRLLEYSAVGEVIDHGEFAMPNQYGKIHYYNGRQYYGGEGGVWCLDEETTTWENLVLWDNSGMDIADYPPDLYIVSKDHTRILTCGQNNKNISLFKTGSDPRAEKTKLLAIGNYVSEAVLSAIQEFNNSNSTCFIEYKNYDELVDPFNYLDQDGWIDFDAYYEALFEYLWKSIKEGNGPDLLLRHTDNSGEKFASRFYEYGGLLQDILPLWEKEDAAWRDQYYTNLIDLMKNGDALYSIPYNFDLCNYVLFDNSSEALETEPTYSDWLKYMDDHADGRVFVSQIGQEFLLNCLCYDGASFVDENSNKSMFSSQEFKDLLRLSKEYCLSEAEWNNGNYGEPVMERHFIDAYFLEEIILNHEFEKNGVFKGLVSKDGGHACIMGETVSITSNCKDVEAAWEFIKILMSPETQEYYLRQEDYHDIYLSSFPILRSSMDYLLDFFLNPKDHEEYWRHAYSDVDMAEDWTIDMMTPMTEEEAQTVRDFISSVDYVYYSDIEIVNVVMEESAAYFAGQKTIDEVVAIIDNRVQTILNERQ